LGWYETRDLVENLSGFVRFSHAIADP
jgi:hypothetical protein